MRITVLAAGSRGDVQPYIALGAGLRAAGHQVRLATHEIYAPLLDPYGIELFPTGGDLRTLLGTETVHTMLAAGENPLGFLRNFARLLEPVFRHMFEDTLNACTGADAVILSGIGLISSYDLVDNLGLPACASLLQPATPTCAFASPFFPDYPTRLPGRGGYNRLSHYAFLALLKACCGPVIARARRELGFPQMPRRNLLKDTLPLLYGFSPSFIPPPPDWPSNAHVTGYWFLDHPVEWQPPQSLVDFLAAGPPPVYIGFGSMSSRRPEEVTALVVEALARAGQRGVLFTGWDGMSACALPETIFPVDSFPHDWLFPRMAAIVTHGGAGTTAAALRAGVPAIVIPFFADQPFWARQVQRAGVGPPPIPRAALTAERLAEAITITVADHAMHERAAALGARIRAEDGVGEAVAILERYFTEAS